MIAHQKLEMLLWQFFAKSKSTMAWYFLKINLKVYLQRKSIKFAPPRPSGKTNSLAQKCKFKITPLLLELATIRQSANYQWKIISVKTRRTPLWSNNRKKSLTKCLFLRRNWTSKKQFLKAFSLWCKRNPRFLLTPNKNSSLFKQFNQSTRWKSKKTILWGTHFQKKYK